MSDKTKIQWTDATWNPVTGCTAVSPGCANCYAAKLAATRLKKQPRYAGLAVMRDGTPRWTGEVRLHEDKLAEPMRWRKPKKVFVCDMADLFHKDVPFEFIDRVFAVMALCPHITFQLLTKRPERMAEWFNRDPGNLLYRQVSRWLDHLDGDPFGVGFRWDVAHKMTEWRAKDECWTWPLPNVWLGTSIENQAADERIMHLLGCPAAVRFLSVEPLLGPLNLLETCRKTASPCWCGAHISTAEQDHVPRPHRLIHWVIVGGESGKKARPCNVAWIRSIVEQCKAAGVACFVKQLGAHPLEGGDFHEKTGPMAGITLRDSHGGDPSEWHEDLRVREFPGA